MNLSEIRKRYPQYADIDDAQLVQGLHKKFYADMPVEDFYAKVGYSETQAAPKSDERGLLTRTFDDLMVSGAKGVGSAIQGGLGLDEMLTGGTARKILNVAGAKPGQTGTSYDPKQIQAGFEGLYSPEQQAANQEVAQAEGFTGKLGAMVKNPSTIVHSVAESVPSMAVGMGIGRGVVAAAPKVGSLVGAAIGEGAISMGQSAEDIRSQTPSGELSFDQARKAVASGIGTSIFSIVGGRIAKRLGLADIDTMLVAGKTGATQQGIVKRIVGGGISEGAFEELPQSVQETIWQNAALGKPLMEGVPENAAQGLVTGAAMGGGANIAARGGQKETPRTKEDFLAAAREDLAAGVIDAEGLNNLAPVLKQEYGIEQADIDGLVSPTIETVDSFDQKVDIAQKQVDADTSIQSPDIQTLAPAKNPLQALRDRAQRKPDNILEQLKANKLKQAKSAEESAKVFEQGMPPAAESFDVFDKAGLTKPVDLQARERNQRRIDQTNLEAEAEIDRNRQLREQMAQQAAQRRTPPQQIEEPDQAADEAIAAHTDTKRRFTALATIWDTLSEQQRDKAINLILPQQESAEVERGRQEREKARTLNRTTPEQRAVEAGRKLKEADRLGLKLDPAYRAQLEAESQAKPEQPQRPDFSQMKPTGTWAEPDAQGQVSVSQTPENEPQADLPVTGEAQTKQVHDYSSTQINLPEAEANEVRNFAAKIPESEIYTAPDDTYGRESEPHVTVRYGMESVDPAEIAPAFEGMGPIKAKMGKVSIFETDKYDVVKVEVDSPELREANKRVGDTVDLPGETFKDYQPHATIAYVKKGEGKKYVGDKSFEGKEITINEVVLSAKDGNMHPIKLQGQVKQTPATLPKPDGKEGLTKREAVAKSEPMTSKEGPGDIPTKQASDSPKGGKSDIVVEDFNGKELRKVKVFVTKKTDIVTPTVEIRDGRIDVFYNPDKRYGMIPTTSAFRLWVNRKIDEVLAPLGEDVYFRSTNNAKDFEYLQNRTHRGSKNWRDDIDEGGLSVAAAPEFPSDYAYFVKGKVIGQGTDQEPLLDTASATPVSELMSYKQAVSLYNKKRDKALKKHGLTSEQYRLAFAEPRYVETDDLPNQSSPSQEVGTDRRTQPRESSDRRKDTATRKRIDEMTPEEKDAEIESLRKERITDKLTGLGNRTAYEESDKKPIQASIDVDSLKWVNDNLGHEVGDELLKMVGKSLKETGIDAYHPSGDEFWAQGTDKEIDAAMDKAAQYLKNNPITATEPSGKQIKFTAGFSYGKGNSLKSADIALGQAKESREKSGQRAARGERPPGILEERTEGNEDQDRGQRSGKVTPLEKIRANAKPTGDKAKEGVGAEGYDTWYDTEQEAADALKSMKKNGLNPGNVGKAYHSKSGDFKYKVYRNQEEIDQINKAYWEKQEERKKSEREADEKKQAEREDTDGFTDGLDPMRRGKIIAALNKQMTFNKGAPISVKDKVRQLVERGEANPEASEEDAIKPMSRTRFNRADQKEQDAHERKRKSAGKKTVYYVGGFDLGKIAYDYANYLIEKQKASANETDFVNTDRRPQDAENRATFSVKQALKDQTGSTEIAKDIFNYAQSIVNKGIKSYPLFRTKIFTKFRKAWDKIKTSVRPLWESLKSPVANERGHITLKGAGKEVKKIDLPVTEFDYEQNRKLAAGMKIKAVANMKMVVGEIAEGTDKYLGAISTRLGNISPKLKAKLRKLDFDINTKSAEDVQAVMPLLQKAKKKMTGNDYTDWDYARKNSDTDKIWFLADKYGLREDYKKYRATLDRIRQEGIDVGLEIGQITEYAPRVLKDKKGFLKMLGKGDDWPIYSRKLAEKAKQLGMTVAEMDHDTKADIISNMILGGGFGLSKPGATKQRKIKTIPPELNKFYMDSDAALMAHIHTMRKSIEARKFFGKVPAKVAEMKTRLKAVERKKLELDNNLKGELSPAQKRVLERYQKALEHQNLTKREKEKLQKKIDSLEAIRTDTLPDEIIKEIRKKKNRYFGLEKQYKAYIEKYALQRDFRENIGSYVLELIEKGEVKPHQERMVNDILNARFHEQGTHGVIQAYKNFSYMDTMGSAISAMTQIGDLAYAAYEGGMIRSLKNAAKSAVGKSVITKEDVGVERIAQEFADASTLSKALATVFKLSGLSKMDSIGKEALLNSVLEKYQKQARKDSPKLRARIKPIFEGETNSVLDDLRSGTISDNVKLLVYSRLLDFQPVGLSEMPQKYLDSGNGRIFYMLKTFTLKQFDIYRNEVYNKIKNGTPREKLEGVQNFVKLSMFFVLANAGADELKDFVLGRETSLHDKAVDNILRLAGASKFLIWQARKEGLGSAVVRQILPPFQFIDSVYKDIVTDEETPRVIKSIPLAGKIAYWHMRANE